MALVVCFHRRQWFAILHASVDSVADVNNDEQSKAPVDTSSSNTAITSEKANSDELRGRLGDKKRAGRSFWRLSHPCKLAIVRRESAHTTSLVNRHSSRLGGSIDVQL